MFSVHSLANVLSDVSVDSGETQSDFKSRTTGGFRTDGFVSAAGVERNRLTILVFGG
jgi:hypothetical protein